jgi:cobalt-zinc-cadmium efflux system outer membrane protein
MCLVLCGLTGAVICHAGAGNTKTYTLEATIDLALNRNPLIAGAQATVEQSQGQKVLAGAFLNPTVTGSAGRGSIRDPSTGLSVTERTITVEQPFEWIGKRVARQRAADAGVSTLWQAWKTSR